MFSIELRSSEKPKGLIWIFLNEVLFCEILLLIVSVAVAKRRHIAVTILDYMFRVVETL